MKYDFRDPSYLYKDAQGTICSTLPEKVIENFCIECDKDNHIVVNQKDYDDWVGNSGGIRKMVQNVFTWLKPEQIEILVSGVHAPCWDEIFKKTRE